MIAVGPLRGHQIHENSIYVPQAVQQHVSCGQLGGQALQVESMKFALELKEVSKYQ